MRIVVASPPRWGNHWVRCLLARAYGLRELEGDEKPAVRPEDWARHAAADGFPDGTILHVHARCSPRLCAAIEATPARLVTVVRDPYDAFVSYYHWVQVREARESGPDPDEDAPRPRAVLVGKPIDHPDALAYLAEVYGKRIARGVGWLESGRSEVVRYEDLHADPAAALAALTGRIRPVWPEAIAEAVDGCGIDAMRQRLPHTVRSGRVGDARQELSEAHLRVFRERHAGLVGRLGYPVR